MVPLFVLLCVLPAVLGAPAEDAVSSLPLWGPPPTPQYSGFLDASAAEPGTYLHYWFAQSSSATPSKDPVVLWLNGGPGSSSILGMLQEHGPLLINGSGGLMANPYAWTNFANVFVLESPAGVGFSYCKDQLTGGNCNNTDISTAAAARAAVQDFFKTKFPELKSNDFYIAGESYAGVYIPTLAAEILDNATDVNLVGIAVGDPCTDNESQRDSMDMLWYGHKNGFVPDDQFDFLWNTCGMRVPSLDAPPSGVNGPPSPECRLAYRYFLGATSRAFSQTWKYAWINDLTLFGPAAVVDSSQSGSLNYQTAAYMMRADVRAALHVDKAPAKQWPGPSNGWSYTKQWAACNGAAPPGTPSMVDFYRQIVPKLKRTIVFNGDTDPCVSYEGTRNAIAKVGFTEVEGGAYRPWFFNATATTTAVLTQKPLLFGPDLALQEGGPQLGGMVVDYKMGLSFVTVHGSGHMVPQFRPRAALHLLAKLLRNEPFAPLYASAATIRGFTDEQFDSYLDIWTTKAKAAPFVPEL